MNINRFIIILAISALSLSAMDHDGVSYDVRHHRIIGNNYYCLVDHHGDGLTDVDVTLLKFMVQFAHERCDEDYVNAKFICYGAQAAFAAYILAAWTGHIMLPKEWVISVCAVGGLAGYCINRARRPLDTERTFITTLRNLINAANAEAASRAQASGQQQPGAGVFGRLALGKLFVPEHHCELFADEENQYYPLQCILLNPESPLNARLDIKPEYRGDRIFVRKLMELLAECEK